MGIKAHFLKDNNGNKFYPYAHASAVFDSNGQKVEKRLDDLDTNKIDKQDGKSLSSNDYTDEEKNKLASIQSNAEQNVQSDWNEIDSTSDAYIKNKPTSLPSNGGNSDTVNGHTVNSDVPANAKFTDTIYDDTEIKNSITEINSNLNESISSHTSNTSNPHNVTAEQLGLEYVVESEVATDFSEAETPKFQQTIDDVLDGVDELKSDLINFKEHKLEVTIPNAGSDVYDFKFSKGFTYILTNNSTTSNIIVRTRDAQGQTVETISDGLLPKHTVNFIPTNEAEKLFVYANGNASFTIECVETFAYVKTLLNALDMSTIKSERQLSSVDSIIAHPECANLDELKINSIYTYTSASLQGVTSKFPFPKGFTILTFNSLTDNYAGCVQIAFDLIRSNIAFRINAGSWSEWNYTGEITFTVGTTGLNDFSTLKSCCDFIKDNNVYNSKVIVKKGTYDLVSEFGQSYLDSIVQTENKGIGLMIGNNTHFIFEKNAKVTFDYNGNNLATTLYFSPFNVYGSFILENAIIECQNCRYCVHEDVPTSSDVIPSSYTVKYIECIMTHKGNPVQGYEAPVCIGGGTYPNSLSIFEGGIYSCSTTFPYPISYHNANAIGSSSVVLRNVFANHGVRFADFGTGNYVDVLISGCCIQGGINKVGDTYFNISKWNNVSSLD